MRKKRGGGAGVPTPSPPTVDSKRSGCRTRRGGGGGDVKPEANVAELLVPDRSRSRVAKRGGKTVVPRFVKRKADKMEDVKIKVEVDEEDPPQIKVEVEEEVDGGGNDVAVYSNKRTKLEGGDDAGVVEQKVKKEFLVVEGNPLENKEVKNIKIVN